MPTEAQVEKLLRATEPKSKRTVSPYALPTPARIVIAGASGSGKTRAWIKYLCSYGVEQFDAVYWCSPTRSLSQGKLNVMKRCWKQYFVSIPSDEGQLNVELLDEHLNHAKTQDWEVLVVFDDLLGLQKHPRITDLYVSGRHSKISTCTIGQSIFGGNRTMRANASALWIFGLAERRQFAELAERLTSTKEKSRLLTRAYDNIQGRNDHGSILIVLNCPSTEKLPLRVRDTAVDCLIPELWRL